MTIGMDLLHEMVRAARSLADARMAEALVACGLDPRRHEFGFDWVDFSGLTYDPVPHGGASALIVPVIERGEVIDLVACRLSDRRIATRCEIGSALGLDRIAAATCASGRLLLFTDPLSWLMSHYCGAVLLDWRRVPFLLDGIPEIVCESASLARRVHATTRRMARPPRLLVYRERTARHAA